MKSFKIRSATIKDADQVVKIYQPYVEDMATSFEYEVPTPADFANRIDSILMKFPYIVAESEGNILGYAYAGLIRSRQAYSWSVEVSVYVSIDHQRMGIGKSLYLELFAILRQQGVVNAYAGVTLPNEASVALHEGLGFEKIGVYKDIGYKFGKWWDVGWWQLKLLKVDRPGELIAFSSLNQDFAQKSIK